MVGSFAALIIAYWYYQSAMTQNRNPVKWAGIGLLIYFIPAVIWTILVTPGLRDTVEHNQSVILGFIVRYAYVVVGVGCSVWVQLKHLRKDQ